MGLFEDYPDRTSQISRDRIYSLAHVATDGNSVPIDYNLAEDHFF